MNVRGAGGGCMSGRVRGAGFGVGVRGLSILTEAKQNGTVHRSVPRVLIFIGIKIRIRIQGGYVK